MGRDISKEHLYESVKALVECELNHVHLAQHKLFTLFSIAFQYTLFKSTKEPGAYIIRVEDSRLVDKLCRKSKDPSTRKFMQSLSLPRKLKYGKSVFFLDFFNVNSWNLTSEIPPEKLKGSIIIKDSAAKPMMGDLEAALEEEPSPLANLPEDYYLTTLLEACPKNIIISFDESIDGVEQLKFPFIVKEEAKTISGVTLGKDVKWDTLE